MIRESLDTLPGHLDGRPLVRDVEVDEVAAIMTEPNEHEENVDPWRCQAVGGPPTRPQP